MTFQISQEDKTFKDSFECGAVLPSEFNHRAHVRLAYIYLGKSEPNVAYRKMKRSIRSFLNHHQIDANKYHETLTRAWTMAVYHFMVQSGSAVSSQDFLSKNSRLLDTEIMLTHYSKSLLFSDEARQHFVKPNLDVIPQYM